MWGADGTEPIHGMLAVPFVTIILLTFKIIMYMYVCMKYSQKPSTVVEIQLTKIS